LKLTPLEIRKQEFKKTLRGFDPIEVRTFLEMVAEQFEKQQDEMKLLSNKLIELQTQLKSFQETEKNLRETLFNVQEVKKQSEESSKRQADLIVKEAELKSIEILENARKQARQMREEVSWLKSQKESFINRLRHILLSQVELLSVLEIDDSLPEDVQKILRSGKSRKQIAMSSLEDEEIIGKGSEDNQPTISIEDNPPSGKKSSEKDDSKSQNSSEKKTANVDKKNESARKLSESEINDYFKKGIQIDDLIETLNKKDKKK
jgi:cell division initiation protein